MMSLFKKSSPEDMFFFYIDFREREGAEGGLRGRETKKHCCERQTSTGCLSYAP